MIASSLKNISSACASLQFEDAGSIALTLARQTQHSSGNHDDTSLITELLSSAAINLDKESKEGKSPAPVDGQLHWTLAAAINTLFLHSFDPSTASQWIQPAMGNVYLPLLSSKSGLDASQREQVVQAAVAVISSHASAWQFSLELLKTFFSSTTRDSSNKDSSTRANDQAKILELDPGMIYFSSRLIEAAAAPTPTTENEQGGGGSDLVLVYASESIFPLALATLASSSTKNPTPTLAAIGQTLLPTALAAAKKIGKLSSCLTILWSTCQALGQSTNGLSLLVQFCQPLLQHGNIVHDPALWELLLSALSSDKGLHRKRALHVLENAIAQLQEEGDDKNKQTIAAWGTFIRLYITVDDTSLHLFKEAWPDIDRLHPPAAAAPSENTTTILGLPVPWILLLWKRALQHRHLTAQKLAALSFLQRAWPEHVLAQIPPNFCSEVLITVLGQGVMQRGEYCEEINALVDGFFQKWSNALPRRECLELLKSFLTTLSGQQQQQTMMKLTYTALIASTTTGFVFEAEEQAQLVRGAIAAAAAQPGFGANAVALKIYVELVSALSKCVVIDSTEMLYLVTSFLAAIPVPLLQPGGLLSAQLVEWFSRKAHASLLPSTLESLVNTHLDSLKLGSSSSSAVEEGVEENKGLKGPSPKQIACGALILAEAIALSSSSSSSNDGSSIDGAYIAEKCLDSVFSTWKAEFSTTTQISTAALPLLAALLASVKELPTTSAAASPRFVSKVWLSKLLYDICDALCSAVDTKYSVWLLSMTQRGALENISASIEIECANRNISKDEAFNNDDVLPREFVEKRNEACNALVCIAEAPTVLSGVQNLEAAAEKYASCAAGFVKTCCTGYPSLFADFDTETVDKRVVLEAAIAVLRPLVACSHSMAWPSSAGSNKEGSVLMIESEDIISLVSSLLDTLETARGHTPPPAPRKKSEKGRTNNKKRKSSWKLEPLTLYSWHNALSWRILEALVATDAAEESQIFPLELQGRIFAAALVGISEAPEGSNAVIPYIRCLRSMIPSLVENAHVIVPAVVATAKTAAATSTNCSETNAEKQHFRDLLSRLVAAGDTATLNDVVAWMGDALLCGLNIHVRKRVGMTAAVLSCCLHPSFFQPGQHVKALHQKEGNDGTAVGAVRNIVHGFFDASTRHSRTFVLFSTQFSALLAAFPAVGAAYTDVLVELLQMGFDEETHLQSLNDAILDEPTVAELTSLLEPLDPALAKAHMASYAAPRVGSLCLLHFWVHQRLAAELKTTNSDIKNSQGSEYLIGLAAAREIWSLLFNLALTDPELSTGRYLHRGPTHRKKLRVWQALTVLCPAVPQSAVEETLALLLEALDVANAATVKQYQEIIALKMIQSQPDLLESMVLPLIADYSEQRNEAIPCLMSIAAVSAFFAAKKYENDTVLEETKKKELIKRAVSIMLPWTATFVHGSRTFAQLILWRMGQVYPWLQENDASYAAFFKFFHTNADLKRLRLAMGIDFGLDNFDFQRATSPKGILCEEMCLLGTSNTTAGPLEGVPEPLMDCLAAYLAQERFALRNEIDAKMADFALQDELRRNAVVQGEEGGKIRAAVVREVTANGNGTASQDSAALSGEENKLAGDFYQRKITPSDKEAAVTDPWGAALGLAALSSNTTTQTANKGNAVVIDNFEADTLRRAVDEAVSTAQSQARQELIIVASLIDKLPNLAGLARTCEVFRASKLVLQDASITKDPTFTSISVSAEHWVPIEQVSPVVLAPWLRKKATEGYTLVGLEQTAESTRLQEFKFPKKTVLLLGAEKEGVPADLLALLDATVEIPQLGVVRSLNVHVSAAIGIYEFTRQSLAAA